MKNQEHSSPRRRSGSKADESLVNRITEQILSGGFAPGQRLTEEALAEQFGVSRTPIRNILPGLAARGLLDPVGRRGFAVKAFSEKESSEALELRALLEGQAARLLARKGARTEILTALDACLVEGDRIFAKGHLVREDEQRYGTMNAEFHRLIVEGSESSLLKGLIDRLNLVPFVAPSVMVFDQVGHERAYHLLLLAHGCHHAIVEAIREKDGARAESLFREHGHQQRLSMLVRLAQRTGRAGQGV